VLSFRPRFITDVYADEDGILHSDHRTPKSTLSAAPAMKQEEGFVPGEPYRA
jgi:hypothetical protein